MNRQIKFMRQTDLMQLDVRNCKFCSLCLLEYHVRHAENLSQMLHKVLLYKQAQKPTEDVSHGQATKSMLPAAVPMLIRVLPEFNMGQQGDAQEFLLFLLENLIQATFQYNENVCFRAQWESFIPRVFQGLLEQQFICQSCGHTKRVQEPFLDLSLNIKSS